MLIWENGKVREMTAEEITEIEAQEKAAERDYWRNTPYDDAVNIEIRKQYDESDEFAILRQKDEKPAEYAEYYTYCEQCKAYVKDKQKEATT